MSPNIRLSALGMAVAGVVSLLPTPVSASFRCGLFKRNDDSCRVIVCRPNPCQVTIPEECCLPNPCCNAYPVVSVAEAAPPVADPIVLAQAETPAVAEAMGLPPNNTSGLDPGVPTGHGVNFPGNNPMGGQGINPPSFFGGGGGGGFGGGGGGGGYPGGSGNPGGGGGGGTNTPTGPGGGGGSGTEEPGGGEEPGGNNGGGGNNPPVHAPAPPAYALGLVGSALLWLYRRRVK